MKLPAAILITLVLPLLASAQNLSGEPSCASACLSTAISAAGCAPTDQACQCGPTSTQIGLKAESCLLANCPASAIGAIESIGAALCAEFSSHLTMTSMGSSSGTTILIGTTSGSGTSRATATATVTGGTTAVVTSSASVSRSASGSGSSAASGTVSTTAGGTSGSASGSRAPATTSSNAAVMSALTNGPGVAAALFLGLLALL